VSAPPSDTPVDDRRARILAEFLVVERDGRDLYDAALQLAPRGERYERLFDFRTEADRRMGLLEHAMQQLGLPIDAPSSGVLRLAPLAADAGPRHLVEALLLFELRDELVGETLGAMGREEQDPRVAEAAQRAAMPIQSNEAWGAHDSSRHRERIDALTTLLRQLVREDAGLA
jgi:hypothetical protein